MGRFRRYPVRWPVAWLGTAYLLALAPTGASAQGAVGPDSFKAARWMLRDATVRSDQQGVELARQRRARFTSDSTHGAEDAYYELAVADYIWII
jgi:hypothetical protein